MNCKICGWCPCCKTPGAQLSLFHKKYFPNLYEELVNHYKIFPEHKLGGVFHTFEDRIEIDH